MSAGRPRKFKTTKELEDAINKYFESAKPRYEEINGILTYIHNHPTMTGLALALGFESRQSLYDYGKNPKYSYIIKKAQLMIENSYELELTNPDKKPTGPIFVLKNMGWSDKQDIQITGSSDKEPVEIKWE